MTCARRIVYANRRSILAASLETRAPFLDRDLTEFAGALPMRMKVLDGSMFMVVGS